MTRIRLWLLAIGGFAAAVFGAWFAGRREGQQSAELSSVRRRTQTMQEAHEVRDEIDKIDDSDMHRALTRWMRDP